MEATRKLIFQIRRSVRLPGDLPPPRTSFRRKREPRGELHTLNEILKLSGAGGSGEKTKGDAASNESNAVLGLPSALLWSGNVVTREYSRQRK